MRCLLVENYHQFPSSLNFGSSTQFFAPARGQPAHPVQDAQLLPRIKPRTLNRRTPCARSSVGLGSRPGTPPRLTVLRKRATRVRHPFPRNLWRPTKIAQPTLQGSVTPRYLEAEVVVTAARHDVFGRNLQGTSFFFPFFSFSHFLLFFLS